MDKYQITGFTRLDGSGKSFEYRDRFGHTLAYIDYSPNGQDAEATVFDPATGHSRRYDNRPAARAEAIVERHLTKLGFEAPEEEVGPKVEVIRKGISDAVVRVHTLIQGEAIGLAAKAVREETGRWSATGHKRVQTHYDSGFTTVTVKALGNHPAIQNLPSSEREELSGTFTAEAPVRRGPRNTPSHAARRAAIAARFGTSEAPKDVPAMLLEPGCRIDSYLFDGSTNTLVVQNTRVTPGRIRVEATNFSNGETYARELRRDRRITCSGKIGF
jgi:hypothetical protein